MIDVEGKALGEIKSAEDVPESSGILRIDAIAYMKERLIHLRCMLEDQSEASAFDAEEKTEDR